MSILVVDDNTMLLSKIVRSLTRANRCVRSATSLGEARGMLEQEMPEVLCLDLQLPDGSGMELLEEIRNAGHKIPVIIISGHYSEQNREHAEQLGVTAFFSKPFVLQDLHQLLDDLLDNGREAQNPGATDENREYPIELPVLETLDRGRVQLAKRAYTTRRVDLDDAAQLVVANYLPKAGDLVLARVDRRQQHTHIQFPDGRRALMNSGDEIIVCYGNRYAPDQFESEIPDDLSPCHLVAAGGIASRALSRNKAMKPATEITPLGVLADNTGRPLNIRDYALPETTVPSNRPPVTVVIGSSMNAGKTTVACDLILGMARQGLRVGSAKVTGTGAGGDIFRMRDSGAVKVLDFTDCGYPTTYKTPLDECIGIMRTLIGQLCAEAVDSIVIEIADGILQAETRGLLQSVEFVHLCDDIVFAASDALGALGGNRWLLQNGLNVVAVSGVITSSPLAMREFSSFSQVPVMSRNDLKTGQFPRGRLEHQVAAEAETAQISLVPAAATA